jgi:hypothetical protein
MKNESIPLLPDVPTSKQKYFHEESLMEVFLCLIYHGEETKVEIPLDVQRSPALLAKRAAEEEMKSCFLYTPTAKHTSVVVPL